MRCGGCCCSISGYNVSAPMSGALSRGTPGRTCGSTSEPHPGMVAEGSPVRRCCAMNEIPPGTGRLSRSSLDDPSVCSRMLPPSVQPTRGRRDQQWFDDAVEFAREHVVRLADLLERKAMRDEVARVDVTRLDVVETPRQ